MSKMVTVLVTLFWVALGCLIGFVMGVRVVAQHNEDRITFWRNKAIDLQQKLRDIYR